MARPFQHRPRNVGLSSGMRCSKQRFYMEEVTMIAYEIDWTPSRTEIDWTPSRRDCQWTGARP